MKVACSAPDCKNKVEISGMRYIGKMTASVMRGGDFSAAVFCPEHDERMSGGKIDDNNPNTNPDLIPLQNKK